MKLHSNNGQTAELTTAENRRLSEAWMWPVVIKVGTPRRNDKAGMT